MSGWKHLRSSYIVTAQEVLVSVTLCLSHHVLSLLERYSQDEMEFHTWGREVFHDLEWVQLGTGQTPAGHCPFHPLQCTSPPQTERLDFTHERVAFTELDHLQRDAGNQ